MGEYNIKQKEWAVSFTDRSLLHFPPFRHDNILDYLHFLVYKVKRSFALNKDTLIKHAPEGNPLKPTGQQAGMECGRT